MHHENQPKLSRSCHLQNDLLRMNCSNHNSDIEGMQFMAGDKLQSNSKSSSESDSCLNLYLALETGSDPQPSTSNEYMLRQHPATPYDCVTAMARLPGKTESMKNIPEDGAFCSHVTARKTSSLKTIQYGERGSVSMTMLPPLFPSIGNVATQRMNALKAIRERKRFHNYDI